MKILRLLSNPICVSFTDDKVRQTFVSDHHIFYQFDFPKSKRTILTDVYKYVDVPPFSVLINDYNPSYLLVGEIIDNKLYGMKINGYKPWACGNIFMKQVKNPEKDIFDLMNIFWNSTFPYYHYEIVPLYINLNQFEEIK